MERDSNRNLLAIDLIGLLLVGGAVSLSVAQGQQAEFTFAIWGEPESLDPKRVVAVPEGRVLRTFSEGLTNLHPETLKSMPAMAKHWDISKDGRTYTFYIRKEAKWSDGSRLTSRHFLYSWRRVLDPNVPAGYLQPLSYVKNAKAYASGKMKDFSQVGIKAPDTERFVVTLDKPTPFFLQLSAFCALFPVHEASVKAHPDDWHHPKNLVCNGRTSLSTERSEIASAS